MLGKPVVPTKWLRSQRPKEGEEGSSLERSAMDAQTVDLRELMPAVSILKTLKKMKLKASSLKAEKWQTRKEILSAIMDMSGKKLVTDDNLDEIISGMREIIKKDKVVHVVIAAVQATGVLAMGLAQKFSRTAKQFVPCLLNKYKDKSKVLISKLNQVFEAMFENCFSLSDIVEKLEVALSNSNPQIKEHALLLLNSQLAKAKPITDELIKFSCESFVKSMGEKFPEVRAAGITVFSTVLKEAGNDNKVIKPYLQSLQTSNPRVYAKVTGAKSGTEDAKKKKKKSVEKSKSETSSSSNKKGKTVDKRNEKKEVTTVKDTPIPEEPAMALDDAVAKLTELIGDEKMNTILGEEGMTSTKWNEKVAAISSLSQEFQQMGDEAIPYTSAFFYILYHKCRSFKESNFNIAKTLVAALQSLVSKVKSNFTITLVNKMIAGFAAKIGDKKVAPVLHPLLEHQ